VWRAFQNIDRPDLLPLNAAKRKLVTSVFRGKDGHEEEAFHRAADHRFLKHGEAGVSVKQLCGKRGFIDAAFYGWRSKFGGLQLNEAKRLKELAAEYAKPKKLLAEAHLDVVALKVAFGVKR
jgi:putative transposase